MQSVLKWILEAAIGPFFKWALGLVFGKPAVSIDAVAQSEKDRADGAEQTITDIARGQRARDSVRDNADDIVRDPFNAG